MAGENQPDTSQGDGGSVQEVGRTWGKVGRGNLLPQPRVPLTLVEPHNSVCAGVRLVRTVHPVGTGYSERTDRFNMEGGSWMLYPYLSPK